MDDKPHCRLDQWLVAARFFKTRQLAIAAINNGRILHSGQRCKPARLLQIGDMLEIQKTPTQIYTLRVLALATRRPSASIAATFYQETAESQAKRQELQQLQQQARALVEFPQHRPDKRERRQLRAIHRQSS